MNAIKANTPTVISETIDGEVVLIHFDTGNYYLIGGSGADVWSLVERGATKDQIVSAVAARYAAQPNEVESAITGFIGELIDEGLAIPAENPDPITLDAAPAGALFEAPAVSRFEDMSEMLLLDPIHDVGETGWPHQPGNGN